MTVLIPLFCAALALSPVVPPQQTVIEAAQRYGVDPDYMLCLWERESSCGTDPYGDLDEETGEYKALGPFQFHRQSWQLVRRQMGRDPAWTLALDLKEAAETTAYAIGVMGLEEWWATDGLCKEAA